MAFLSALFLNRDALIASMVPEAQAVTDQLTIDTVGNPTYIVGNLRIGTTAPSAKLDIARGSGITVQVGSPPAGNPAMNLGRVSGQPSIKSTSDWLIMDSITNPAALNYFTTSQQDPTGMRIPSPPVTFRYPTGRHGHILYGGRFKARTPGKCPSDRP